MLEALAVALDPAIYKAPGTPGRPIYREDVLPGKLGKQKNAARYDVPRSLFCCRALHFGSIAVKGDRCWGSGKGDVSTR